MGALVSEEGNAPRHLVLVVILLAALMSLFMGSAGSTYIETLALAALAALCIAINASMKTYEDAEFTSIAKAFLSFALLFLFAQVIFVFGSPTPATFYVLNGLWLAGFLPPLWACWRTILRYGEYVELKDFILITLVVFCCSLALLLPIGIAVASSPLYPGIANKIIAVTYPFFDAILVLGLLTLLHIYKRGHLETYWESITTGILIFTLADMGNAVARAYQADTLSAIFDSLYGASYLYLAYGFGMVAYRKRKSNVMVPGRMYQINEVFLIHKSGILATYVRGDNAAGGEDSGIDRDILGGMLTAVQTFIRDSFDRGEWNEEGGSELKRLQYGGLEIHIENGRHTFLAVVLDGKGTDHLHAEMLGIVRTVEQRYGQVLENWSGRMDLLAGVEDIIREKLF